MVDKDLTSRCWDAAGKALTGARRLPRSLGFPTARSLGCDGKQCRVTRSMPDEVKADQPASSRWPPVRKGRAAGVPCLLACRCGPAGRPDWAVINANAILALRCCLLSGQYEDFWANRADTPRLPPAIQTPLILYRAVETVMAKITLWATEMQPLCMT